MNKNLCMILHACKQYCMDIYSFRRNLICTQHMNAVRRRKNH